MGRSRYRFSSRAPRYLSFRCFLGWARLAGRCAAASAACRSATPVARVALFDRSASVSSSARATAGGAVRGTAFGGRAFSRALAAACGWGRGVR